MESKKIINLILYFLIVNLYFYFFIYIFFEKIKLVDILFCIMPVFFIFITKKEKKKVIKNKKIDFYKILLVNFLDIFLFIIGILLIMLFFSIFSKKNLIKLFIDLFLCLFFAKNFLFTSISNRLYKISTKLYANYIYKNIFESIIILMFLCINISFIISLIGVFIYILNLIFLILKKISIFDKILNIEYFYV